MVLSNLQREAELLARTVEILRTVRRDEPIGLRQTARKTAYPQHQVRTAFRVLEENGLVESTEDGAVTTGHAPAFLESLGDEVDEVVAAVERLGTVLDDG